jgi:hypothetical protein
MSMAAATREPATSARVLTGALVWSILRHVTQLLVQGPFPDNRRPGFLVLLCGEPSARDEARENNGCHEDPSWSSRFLHVRDLRLIVTRAPGHQGEKTVTEVLFRIVGADDRCER